MAATTSAVSADAITRERYAVITYWRLALNSPLPRWLFQVPTMPRFGTCRFSILPSITYVTACPLASLASASRCTTQPLGLSVAFLIGMLSVPGLIVPVIALPSQFRTKTMSGLWLVLPAHVPSQEPFRGWPSCAVTGEGARKNETARDATRIKD